MKRKKACAALLCAAMTVSGFPLGGGIVSAQENVTQETDFDIYVSPQGSDSEGDGSEAKPYATIDKAREAARELTADGSSVTVSVGEGKYFLEDPVVFGPEDSNVTYVGDNAVLTGAEALENLELLRTFAGSEKHVIHASGSGAVDFVEQAILKMLE